MDLNRSGMVLVLILLQFTQIHASPRKVEDIDLQDILSPASLAIPPTREWEPLRVRQWGTPLELPARPRLRKSEQDGRIELIFDVKKFVDEPVILTVREGLYVVDALGQTYVPIPIEFEILDNVSQLQLDVVPTSPTVLFPENNHLVGFVGRYNAELASAFEGAFGLLYRDFPGVFGHMERVNDHWQFRDKSQSRRLMQWIRWVQFEGDERTPERVIFPLHFWRFMVWSILDGYDTQDFASWLQTARALPADYATIDASELAEGLKVLYRECGLNGEVLGPQTYSFYYNQGVRAFLSRDLSLAEAYFQEAIRLDAAQLDAHFNLGLTYYRKREYASAAEAWLVGTGLKAADASVFYHRGVALYRLDEPMKAARMFREAIKLDNQHNRAKKWLKVVDPKNQTRPKRQRRRWRQKR